MWCYGQAATQLDISCPGRFIVCWEEMILCQLVTYFMCGLKTRGTAHVIKPRLVFAVYKRLSHNHQRTQPIL
jgi:hypothetical protein